MLPAESPEALLALGREVRARGAPGMLVSGGCDARGRVPLTPFLDALTILVGEGMRLNIHTGLLDQAAASALVSTGAEVFSVDLLQDPRAIEGSLHLRATPRDYEDTVANLIAAGGRVVPHVLVGLQSREAETACLEVLGRHEVHGVVVLGLMPPRGERAADDLEGRLTSFVSGAVKRTGAPVLLGCMRPRGRELEERCLEAGAAGVVNPSPRTLAWAKERGMEIETRELCCALYR